MPPASSNLAPVLPLDSFTMSSTWRCVSSFAVAGKLAIRQAQEVALDGGVQRSEARTRDCYAVLARDFELPEGIAGCLFKEIKVVGRRYAHAQQRFADAGVVPLKLGQ